MNDRTSKTPRSIGQLARAAGLPTSTLRYYEREGLLSPVSRSRAGYRVSDEESLERLKAIRLAQRAGLSLADVKELSDLQGERGFYEAMKQRLAERLREVDERIGQLQELRQRIIEALHCCDTQANCPRECRTFNQSLPEGCADTAKRILAAPGEHPLDLALECKR